jgi:hypothetical protein
MSNKAPRSKTHRHKVVYVHIYNGTMNTIQHKLCHTSVSGLLANFASLWIMSAFSNSWKTENRSGVEQSQDDIC